MPRSKMNVLVVGLTPQYHSSTVATALSDYRATMRSTNIGACFITQSIVSIFEATYVDIMSDLDFAQLRNNYDVCIVSLASHLGPTRDVSILVRFLRKLDIRTVFLSGGLDAGQSGADNLHSSVKELLHFCSFGNQWIGVRGASSALYLHRQGIKNVVPIGCPTMYSNFAGQLAPPSLQSKEDIAVPFHWSIAANLIDELDKHFLIGQDCIDEELFLDNKHSRISKKISSSLGIQQKDVQKKLESAISKNGQFPDSYEDWYKIIGSQKALLSGRLHAAICGLTQGIPTILSSWDIRTQEIIDYFKIPSVSGDTLQKQGSMSVFEIVDFEEFDQRQSECWGRWTEFLRQNELPVAPPCPEDPILSDSNFGKSLHNDNDLLSTASYLRTHNKSSRSLRRILSDSKRNIGDFTYKCIKK